MNLKKLYEAIGSEYQPVLDRFCGYEVMVEKFVKGFLGDGAFCGLTQAVQDLDYPEIERLAHALKGVSANLGFGRLYAACGELVSYVRSGQTDNVPRLYQEVKEAYEIVCHAIGNEIGA